MIEPTMVLVSTVVSKVIDHLNALNLVNNSQEAIQEVTLEVIKEVVREATKEVVNVVVIIINKEGIHLVAIVTRIGRTEQTNF